MSKNELHFHVDLDYFKDMSSSDFPASVESAENLSLAFNDFH